MVAITLPDGSRRDYDGPVTGQKVAEDIGPGLAKAALAVKVAGEVRDLTRDITKDAAIEIVTRGHEDAMELLRHDCAHVLAQAAQEVYPDTQITFGPAIETVSMSSTKSAIGHLLGAAGAVEAIYSIMAIGENVVPPTLNLENPSESCTGVDLVPLEAKERQVKAALSNSFGFGGTNASLVFREFS